MSITTKQYAEALHLALHEANPKDHDKVLDNFVAVLHTNGDLGKYEAVVAEYEKMDLEAQGIKKARVTFARETEVNKKIMDELNQIAGAKLQVEKEVDPDLIGGVVLRVDDTLIDASVRGQLNTLRDTLSK